MGTATALYPSENAMFCRISRCARRAAAIASGNASRATGPSQGLFDHIAFMDIDAKDVKVEDTDLGATASCDVGGEDGSILLLGVAKDDLRQSDFMFNTPQFVDGTSDIGSWYIFG